MHKLWDKNANINKYRMNLLRFHFTPSAQNILRENCLLEFDKGIEIENLSRKLLSNKDKNGEGKRGPTGVTYWLKKMKVFVSRALCPCAVTCSEIVTLMIICVSIFYVVMRLTVIMSICVTVYKMFSNIT